MIVKMPMIVITMIILTMMVIKVSNIGIYLRKSEQFQGLRVHLILVGQNRGVTPARRIPFPVGAKCDHSKTMTSRKGYTFYKRN